MAEDLYRDYKEDQGTSSDLPRRPVRGPDPVKLLRARLTLRRRPSEQAVDYRAFKATMASAVEEIKLEIHE